MVKLSILIAYYKTYYLTIKLLKMLNIQNNKNVEFILIDDGCNEKRFDTFKEKNNFYNLKIIHLSENQGMSNALNIGIDNSHGKYIGFIDSDDMVTIDYIEMLLKVINKADEDIIFFNWADFNKNEIVKRPENYALWKAIYKKKIFPRFEKDRRYQNDVPVQQKLRAGNYSKVYINRVLYIYNSGRKGSLTWIRESKEKEMIE